VARFQSKEEYEAWRAAQRGEAPPMAVAAADDGAAPAAEEARAEQIYDGPAPGSDAFAARARQQAGLSTDRDRNLAMLCHLAALSGFLIPFGNIFGPLVPWMIGKGGSQFVDEHGKASLNFQISITLAAILSLVLIFIVGPMIIVVGGIVAVYALVMVIVNAVKAHNGEEGEYALSTHFLK
jgi:uncharacterized protein